MSPWLKIYDDLPRHPKTTRLCRVLDAERNTVVGSLVCLWTWAFSYAEDGDLRRFSNEDIADAAHWSGDAKEFVEALKKCEWLDSDRRIHDWNDYSGAYISERTRSRNRKKKPLQIADGTGEVPVNFTGSTAAKIKKKKEQEHMSADADPLFDEFWAIYPKKVGKPKSLINWRYRLRDRIPPEDLIRAATNYAAAMAERRTEPRFIKNPEGFLGSSRYWEDWLNPEPKPNGNGGNGRPPAPEGKRWASLFDIESGRPEWRLVDA